MRYLESQRSAMAGTGEINLGKLERELASAIEADRKYSRENDAKFRAVAQRVATYEEFRQVELYCPAPTACMLISSLEGSIL